MILFTLIDMESRVLIHVNLTTVKYGLNKELSVSFVKYHPKTFNINKKS